ncbi:MAG: WYL domain-containing protein [Bacteroidetes bacterium]|nr:MAG: WYL domain-containing protein [Bacteroidota bacterium]
MAKLNFLTRYNLIIKKLKKSPCTLESIFDYLERESEILGFSLTISPRTFQRDIKEILTLYDIEIKYDFSKKVYFITDEFQSELNVRMLDAFDLFQSLKMSENMTKHICFEKRKPQGTTFLLPILQAIKTKNVIEILHQKFSQKQSFLHTLEPLAIKESQGRWYLVAKEIENEKIKTYGLDRISEVNILKTKKTNFVFDVEIYFKDCFGIIKPENEEFAPTFELLFSKKQGNYIKTYPLHHSQKVVSENDLEIVFSYKLFITHDFVMELLSFGNELILTNYNVLTQELNLAKG